MATRDDDILILALLLMGLYYEDDPEYAEYLYRRLRDRLKQTEAFDPMLDEFLFRRLRSPRGLYKRRVEETREIASSVLEGFRKQFESSIGKRIDELSKNLDSLRHRTEEISSRLTDHDISIRSVADDIHSYLWLVTVGADFAVVPMVRFLPVRIYLPLVPERRVLSQVVAAINALAGQIDLEMADEFPEESGSWWKRFVFKTKQFLTQKQVQERLEKAERALQANYLDKPQAEANKYQAEAASSLISALNGTSTACIQVGSLLVVKATAKSGECAVMARTLSPSELKLLEENQAMLKSPEQILDWLQKGQSNQLPSGANGT
jgi:hypothetical protein